MELFVALVVASLACWVFVRVVVAPLFRGSVERAGEWVRPRRPTLTDIVVSELGEEVANWRFARVALVVVLLPVCFGATFLVARRVLASF